MIVLYDIVGIYDIKSNIINVYYLFITMIVNNYAHGN